MRSKSKAVFECDFILLTETYGMFIIEVCSSVADRVQTSILEKFKQLTHKSRSRSCFIELADELYDNDFSATFGSMCHDRIYISLLELSSSKVPSGGLLYNRILGRHT